jgi:hypothetical protein
MEVTIDQMNEAIARFMGGTRVLHPSQKYSSEHHFGYVCHRGHWWNENNLKYHTSWDWLMPVVEKIETPMFDKNGQFISRTGADVQILYKACIIEYEPDEESGDPCEETKIQVSGETKLEAVYNAVYQFITWYNQQKQNEEGGI